VIRHLEKRYLECGVGAVVFGLWRSSRLESMEEEEEEEERRGG
jgi:hypothetical protein